MELFLGEGSGNNFVIEYNMHISINTCLQEGYIRKCRKLIEEYDADSYLILGEAEGPENDFCMRIIEKDLSESNTCGNGLRVVSKFFSELSTGRDFRIETKSGVVSSKLLDDERVIVEMGKYQYHFQKRFLFKGNIHFCDVGEPHMVMFVDDISIADSLFENFGYEFVNIFFEINGELTNASLNIAQIVSPKMIINRTFERGVNQETKACGSGSVCVANTAFREFAMSEKIKVITNHDTIEVLADKNNTKMIGFANIINPIKDVYHREKPKELLKVKPARETILLS